jgi:DNA repair protein RadD
MLFVQIIGRGLRTADGKDDCLILDHTDTHLRLGFVTDIIHHTLDGGEHKSVGQPGASASAEAEGMPEVSLPSPALGERVSGVPLRPRKKVGRRGW